MQAIAAMSATLSQSGWAQNTSADELSRAFQSQPDPAKPSCYWMWFNNHVDKQGITRDLEEFKAKATDK
jgi:hypothetical protein